MQISCNFSHLQNGSDVRGVSSESHGKRVTFAPADAHSIASSFASFVSIKTGKQIDDLSISIGRDPRLSGPQIRNGVVAALTGMGVEVIDFGIASTPAMFMSCLDNMLDMDGAIMLTASHLPGDRNGMKLFTELGGVNKLELESILSHASLIDADHARFLSIPQDSHLKRIDFMMDYANHLRSVIHDGLSDDNDKPLAGLKIIVDAGNGSGGFFAKDVLEPLGADTTGSQFLDPDGNFPNHVANPEDPEAMQSLVDAVIRNKADMGILFDTDVDRCGIVDGSGRVYNRNTFIAMMSSVCLKETPGCTIVTDSVTSEGLTRFIESHGGQHLRYVRGYRNVIDKAMELCRKGYSAPLAIETSGHGALRENYFLDDGSYMATKLVTECALRNGDLASLVDGFEEPAESKEIRINASKPKAMLQGFREFVNKTPGWTLDETSYEGVRATVDDPHGWLLVRESLHDPVVVVNIESDERGGTSVTEELIMDFFNRR